MGRPHTIILRGPLLRGLLLIAPTTVAAMLAGCQGRALVPNAADGLRAELVERTRERDVARARAAELETKMAELTLARDVKIDPEATEAQPALSGVALSTLSTARLTMRTPPPWRSCSSLVTDSGASCRSRARFVPAWRRSFPVGNHCPQAR